MQGKSSKPVADAGADAGAEEVIRPDAEARAHWSIFLPTVVVALVYGGAWLFLDATGRTGEALGRLIFLVLLLAPPLLLAHAFLRFYSTGVAVTREHILISRGWPHVVGEQIPLSDVESVSVRTSALGRLLGSGTVHIRFWDGGETDAADLAWPYEFVALVQKRLKKVR